MKYKDWAEIWLENYIKPSSKAKTFGRYSEIMKHHILPQFGECEVENLVVIEIQKFITDLLNQGNKKTGKGLSANTVNAIITVIQGSLETAFNVGVSKVYIGKSIKRPKLEENKVMCFNQAEQHKIEQTKDYLQIAKLEYAKRVNSYSDCLQALKFLSEIHETGESKSLKEKCQKQLIQFRTIELQNKGIAPLYFDEFSSYFLNEVIESLVATTKDNQKYNEIDLMIIESCKKQAISYIETNFSNIVDGENKKEQLIKIKNNFLSLNNSVLPSFDKSIKYIEDKIAQIIEQERIIAHKKKVKKYSIVSAIIAAILIVVMIITLTTVNKNNGYKAENFTISVTSKTNDSYNEDLADGYLGSGYYYTFAFTVNNSSPYSTISIDGNMDINNKYGKTLSSSTVTLNGKLEAGKTGNWNIQLNVYKGDNAREIWNTDFSALEVTFKITSISFEDGTIKNYTDTKNQIIHSCSDIQPESNVPPDDDSSDSSVKEDEQVEKTLFEQVTDYIGKNVVLPDNYLEYYSAEPSNQQNDIKAIGRGKIKLK